MNLWIRKNTDIGKMKKVYVCFFIVGIIGVLITKIIPQNIISEDLNSLLFLLFLGFFYAPFYISYIIKRENGEEENIEINNFSDLRFYLGMISYPFILIGYLLCKLFGIFD